MVSNNMSTCDEEDLVIMRSQEVFLNKLKQNKNSWFQKCLFLCGG